MNQFYTLAYELILGTLARSQSLTGKDVLRQHAKGENRDRPRQLSSPVIPTDLRLSRAAFFVAVSRHKSVFFHKFMPPSSCLKLACVKNLNIAGTRCIVRKYIRMNS